MEEPREAVCRLSSRKEASCETVATELLAAGVISSSHGSEQSLIATIVLPVIIPIQERNIPRHTHTHTHTSSLTGPDASLQSDFNCNTGSQNC